MQNDRDRYRPFDQRLPRVRDRDRVLPSLDDSARAQHSHQLDETHDTNQLERLSHGARLEKARGSDHENVEWEDGDDVEEEPGRRMGHRGQGSEAQDVRVRTTAIESAHSNQ